MENNVIKNMDKSILKNYGSYDNWLNWNICNLFNDRDKIDVGILDFIVKLNKHGLYTIFSCSGHKEGHTPYVIFATFVSRDNIVRGMDKIFGEHHYKLVLEENDFGVKFMRMYIYPEFMNFYGIEYTKE